MEVDNAKENFTKNDNPIKNNGRYVIWTCFAGRQHNLEILLRYVIALINKGVIHECHLWNFTRKKEDDIWLRSHFSGTNLPIKVIEPKRKCSWSEYYKHYTKERYKNHIIIKCDDDIVYIDIERFHNFIENREKNPNSLLAFPSIINNAICANYQQNAGFLEEKSELGIFPFNVQRGRLWRDGLLAERLHDYFIDNIDEYTLRSTKMPIHTVDKGVRVSINLFAILSEDLDIFQRVSKGDEVDLTVKKTVQTDRENYIDLSCFVSHLAFYKQRLTGLDEKRILERYNKVADDLNLPNIPNIS